jgi:esterase
MAERVLAHERMVAPGAAPSKWILFLHGIYGSGRNWGTIARRVVQVRPEWGAMLVDLREHGGSRGFDRPHTLEAAARDLVALRDTLGIAVRGVLGHSFGGKVALAYAREGGRGLEQVWVVDSTPDAMPPRGTSWETLAILRRLPSFFGSRQAAVHALEAEGVATGVAQWLATNLEPADGGFRWRLDLDAMEELLLDFFRTDLWDVVENPPPDTVLHFVKAEDSDILSPAVCARIEEAGRRSGRVFLHRLPGGHWLNADNPAGMVALLSERL